MADQTIEELLVSLTEESGGGAVPPSDEIPNNNFKEYFWLQDRKHLTQAEHLTGAFQGAIDPTDLTFNLGRAVQIAQGMPNGTPIRALNQIVVQQSIRIDDLVKHLQQLVRTMLSVGISDPGFLNGLTTQLTGAFVGLGGQEEEKYLFYRSETASSTTYVYNLFFAVQGVQTGGAMGVLPFSLEVTVDRGKKAVEALTLKDWARYQIKATALMYVQGLTAA